MNIPSGPQQLSRFTPKQNKWLREWKDQGKKVVGYFCNAPSELIWAHDIFPVRLFNGENQIEKADGYFPNLFCFYTRSLLELALSGEMAPLDGVATFSMCDAVVQMANVFSSSISRPAIFFISRPHDRDIAGALSFFKTELTEFSAFLEKISGVKLTDESLRQSIRTMNNNRTLLKKIYDLRGLSDGFSLPAGEIASITRISQMIPPDLAGQYLEETLKRIQAGNGPAGKGKKPRIHISGSILPDDDLYKIIEDGGGCVVSDDLCTGSRHFWRLVDEEREPMEALAHYYLSLDICPHQHHLGGEDERLGYIMDMAGRYRVNGVIFCIQRFCDPHQFEYPYLKDKLNAAGLPVLALETEQNTGMEQVKNRVEAFLETL